MASQRTPTALETCISTYTGMRNDAPGLEYAKIGLFFGNFMSVMRISMGDFALMEAVEYLSPIENYLFWLIWILCVIVNCIIFLNFIVAEAGNSYNNVSEELENFI